MPARSTAGNAASPKTTRPYAMKNAAIEYSNALVVPDSSASQSASGMPAIPATPVSTASARIAKRSSESVDSVSRLVVMADMGFPLCWVKDRSGADAATSYDGGSGPVMWESRETAHSEVLGIGEGEGGDGECSRRDHAEFGQRQPPGDEHHGDENRERDVSGQHADPDASDIGQASCQVERRAVAHEGCAADPLRRRRQTGQPRQRIGRHRDEQPQRGTQCRVGAEGETQ